MIINFTTFTLIQLKVHYNYLNWLEITFIHSKRNLTEKSDQEQHNLIAKTFSQRIHSFEIQNP